MAIEFDEPGVDMPIRERAPEKISGITGLVIKSGLVSDKRGARVVLVVIALIAGALAIYFSYSTVQTPPAPTLKQIRL